MKAVRFSVTYRAPDEFTKIAKDAYQRSVGRPLTVITPLGPMPGTLVSAVVQDDGQGVELTFDVPGLELR